MTDGINEVRIESTTARTSGRCAKILQCAAVLLAVVGSSGSALAQTPGRVAGEDQGYLQWMVFGGIAVIVCATGFLNSKRSHLN